MEETEITGFVTAKSAMLEELLKCRDRGKAMGIWSPVLGQGLFICMVKEIFADEDEQDMVVILQENDLLAQQMETHVLYLSEISGIYSIP